MSKQISSRHSTLGEYKGSNFRNYGWGDDLRQETKLFALFHIIWQNQVFSKEWFRKDDQYVTFKAA